MFSIDPMFITRIAFHLDVFIPQRETVLLGKHGAVLVLL